MMTCKDVCERATEHLEGDAGLRQRFTLLFHLMICRACRRFFHQFRTTIGVASALGQLPDPTDEEIDTLLEAILDRNRNNNHPD